MASTTDLIAQQLAQLTAERMRLMDRNAHLGDLPQTVERLMAQEQQRRLIQQELRARKEESEAARAFALKMKDDERQWQTEQRALSVRRDAAIRAHEEARDAAGYAAGVAGPDAARMDPTGILSTMRGAGSLGGYRSGRADALAESRERRMADREIRMEERFNRKMGADEAAAQAAAAAAAREKKVGEVAAQLREEFLARGENVTLSGVAQAAINLRTAGAPDDVVRAFAETTYKALSGVRAEAAGERAARADQRSEGQYQIAIEKHEAAMAAIGSGAFPEESRRLAAEARRAIEARLDEIAPKDRLTNRRRPIKGYEEEYEELRARLDKLGDWLWGATGLGDEASAPAPAGAPPVPGAKPVNLDD